MDQQAYHCITCILHECFLPQSRGGGSFLILQDVMGWATGFFIPCLGEGQRKSVSTETDFAGPRPPPPCTLWPVPNVSRLFPCLRAKATYSEDVEFASRKQKCFASFPFAHPCNIVINIDSNCFRDNVSLFAPAFRSVHNCKKLFIKYYLFLFFSCSVILYSISAVSRHNRQSSHHFLCTVSASVASLPSCHWNSNRSLIWLWSTICTLGGGGTDIVMR